MLQVLDMEASQQLAQGESGKGAADRIAEPAGAHASAAAAGSGRPEQEPGAPRVAAEQHPVTRTRNGVGAHAYIGACRTRCFTYRMGEVPMVQSASADTARHWPDADRSGGASGAAAAPAAVAKAASGQGLDGQSGAADLTSRLGLKFRGAAQTTAIGAPKVTALGGGSTLLGGEPPTARCITINATCVVCLLWYFSCLLCRLQDFGNLGVS